MDAFDDGCEVELGTDLDVLLAVQGNGYPNGATILRRCDVASGVGTVYHNSSDGPTFALFRGIFQIVQIVVIFRVL